MEKLIIALSGGFGGTAPGLVALARSLQDGSFLAWLSKKPDGANANPDIWLPIACAVGAFGVFFIIGAAVALIYKEKVLSKAMLLGIGAPALIMAAAATQEVKPRNADLSGASLGWLSLIDKAYAEDAAPAENSVTFKINPDAGSDFCKDCWVSVFAKNDGLLEAKAFPLESTGEVTVVVPGNAESIVLDGAATNPVSIDVNQITQQADGEGDNKVTIDVARDRNYWNDVQRSLGNRSIQPYDFSVTLDK